MIKIINRISTSSKIVLSKLSIDILPRWLGVLLDLELELKAILLNKANIQTDLPTYFNKRLFPILDCFLNKLYTEQRKLKV